MCMNFEMMCSIGYFERFLLSFSSIELVTAPKRAHTMLPRAHNTANLSQTHKEKGSALRTQRQSEQSAKRKKPVETENVIVDPTAPATSNDGIYGAVGAATAPGAAAFFNGRKDKPAATAALLGRTSRQERIQGVLRVRVPRRQRRQESRQDCPSSRYCPDSLCALITLLLDLLQSAV